MSNRTCTKSLFFIENVFVLLSIHSFWLFSSFFCSLSSRVLKTFQRNEGYPYSINKNKKKTKMTQARQQKKLCFSVLHQRLLNVTKMDCCTLMIFYIIHKQMIVLTNYCLCIICYRVTYKMFLFIRNLKRTQKALLKNIYTFNYHHQAK